LLRRAVGSLVRTYSAGQDDGDAPGTPDSREWVFGLLANPRTRRRMVELEKLELRRRTGCEQCLRALVADEWTPDALHHLGWCDSCRAATVALGMHAPVAEASFFRRRAAWLAVAAFAVVAVPLVGSQVINHGSQVEVRGGSAVNVPATTTPGSTTPVATTPVSTTPAATTPVATTPVATDPGTTTPVATTPVTPVPRSKPATSGSETSARGNKALPLTT
jgi:hypothetical protein